MEHCLAEVLRLFFNIFKSRQGISILSLLEKLGLFLSIRVLFPELYFQIISRNYFHTMENISHTMELHKTMEIGFSNISLQNFQTIPILWKTRGPIFPVLDCGQHVQSFNNKINVVTTLANKLEK